MLALTLLEISKPKAKPSEEISLPLSLTLTTKHGVPRKWRNYLDQNTT